MVASHLYGAVLFEGVTWWKDPPNKCLLFKVALLMCFVVVLGHKNTERTKPRECSPRRRGKCHGRYLGRVRWEAKYEEALWDCSSASSARYRTVAHATC